MFIPFPFFFSSSLFLASSLFFNSLLFQEVSIQYSCLTCSLILKSTNNNHCLSTVFYFLDNDSSPTHFLISSPTNKSLTQRSCDCHVRITWLSYLAVFLNLNNKYFSPEESFSEETLTMLFNYHIYTPCNVHKYNIIYNLINGSQFFITLPF